MLEEVRLYLTAPRMASAKASVDGFQKFLPAIARPVAVMQYAVPFPVMLEQLGRIGCERIAADDSCQHCRDGKRIV